MLLLCNLKCIVKAFSNVTNLYMTDSLYFSLFFASFFLSFLLFPVFSFGTLQSSPIESVLERLIRGKENLGLGWFKVGVFGTESELTSSLMSCSNFFHAVITRKVENFSHISSNNKIF